MGRKRHGLPIHGWIVLDKPLGMSSSRAVGAVRRAMGAAKAGHGGTLDPLATGILPIALGEATKTVQWAMAGRKTYEFQIRWGEARSTDDREGEVVATSDIRPDRTETEAVLSRFTGEISQLPPIYSALKVDGERAYALARQGETVTLAPRSVTIHVLRLIGCPDADHADFEAEVGKGTYIRSLARDIAEALGTVGHVSVLRRTVVGPFALDQAISLENLGVLGHSAAASEHLLPVETPLDDIPALALTEAEAHRLRCGQAVTPAQPAQRERIDQLGNGAILCATTGGKLVALVEIEAGELRPMRVLNL